MSAVPPSTYQKIQFIDTQARLVEQDLPELGPGQILVKARCSLISPGTERAALLRLWDDADFRANPGYALAGVVIETGPDVSRFKPGDRTISLMNHASLSITPAEPWMVLKIPPALSDETATFSTLASVALHAIRRARIEFGETLVILGAGILGLISIQLARMSGAGQVIVLDLAENRLELARRYGADLAINPAEEDPVVCVFAATSGHGAPVLLETAGNPQVIPLAFKLAANGGQIVTTGALEEEVSISFHKEFIRRELSLIAAFQPFCPITDNIYWRWTQQANRRLLLEMLADGRLRVDEMLTHRFPAARAPEVYEHIKGGEREMLGVLLDWS
jgi:2-desacetyl-2-hydroxyethyl bacteriochlorophyllide A dehydrogenase